MIEVSKIVQVLYHILVKIGPTDKIKLVKLVYLSDKYHLLKYARTITNDSYFAMKLGPVGSTLKDILAFNKNLAISKEEFDYTSSLIEQENDFTFKAKGSKRVLSDFLSETDLEAIDFIIEKFGSMSQWDLKNFTHKYPEWKQYKELFKSNTISRENIRIQELISTIPEDPFSFSSKHLEEVKSIISGMHD
ncbi:MAG: SocA family protein [Candidatus Aureabacteria bacterium]|nr:SocA family protein [Candidatus Auribacterota bacterium]